MALASRDGFAAKDESRFLHRGLPVLHTARSLGWRAVQGTAWPRPMTVNANDEMILTNLWMSVSGALEI